MSGIQENPGFTLVELLVAVLVGGILASAAYQVLVNQNRMYTLEEQNIAMQQSARAALDFIARELRLAGFGIPDDNNAHTNVFPRLINNAPEGTENIDAGTDSILFSAGVGQSSLVAMPAAESTAVWVYPAFEKGFEFEAHSESPDKVDLLAYHQEEKVKLNRKPLEIDSVSYGSLKDSLRLTKLVFREELSAVLIPEALGTGLEPGDQVAVCPVTIWYRVNDGVLERVLSNDGGRTWKTTQPLINNVEDLQLSYSFDSTDADSKPETEVPDGEAALPTVVRAIDNRAGGALDTKVLPGGETTSIDPIAYRSNATAIAASQKIGDPTFNPIRGVTVSLLVRSSCQNPDHRFRNRSAQPRVQDHDPDSVSADGFRRRLYEREITFRNLGLIVPPLPGHAAADEGEGDYTGGKATE